MSVVVNTHTPHKIAGDEKSVTVLLCVLLFSKPSQINNFDGKNFLVWALAEGETTQKVWVKYCCCELDSKEMCICLDEKLQYFLWGF